MVYLFSLLCCFLSYLILSYLSCVRPRLPAVTLLDLAYTRAPYEFSFHALWGRFECSWVIFILGVGLLLQLFRRLSPVCAPTMNLCRLRLSPWLPVWSWHPAGRDSWLPSRLLQKVRQRLHNLSLTELLHKRRDTESMVQINNAVG